MASVKGNSSSKLAPPAQRTDASAKIMIVDDEPINIMAVRKYFQDAGFSNVAATSDPRQIMATMERENPDVLLLDIMLPGVDGLDVLKTIRSSDRFARSPSSFSPRSTTAR